MPSVKLKLVSDGGGVRTVLEKMIDNLLATDWIERSFVTSDSSTEKLFKTVARVVTKKPCMYGRAWRRGAQTGLAVFGV